MTIEGKYKDFTNQLKNIYEAREAGNIADWTFESIAGIKRIDKITNRHKQLSNSTIEQLNKVLRELLQYKPIQYVLQEAWFYKMTFFVNNAVLIPRPETEELVEWIVADLKDNGEKSKIIDIGTGSGCIAIALKKELPGTDILAIDISGEALSVAKQNAFALHTALEFIQVNFLDETEWNRLTVVDIIVSNPPYIPDNQKSSLQKNILDYEPHVALFTGAADPFIFYKKIGLFAQSHLNAGGKIYVEIHENYAAEVSAIFNDYKLTTVIKKDIYGRNRLIRAQRQLFLSAH